MPMLGGPVKGIQDGIVKLILAPALSGEKLDRLLARCPGLLAIDERVQVEPGGIVLYEVDIDNDGGSDQALNVQNLYRRLPPGS